MSLIIIPAYNPLNITDTIVDTLTKLFYGASAKQCNSQYRKNKKRI